MTEAAPETPPSRRPAAFWMRFGVAASLLALVLVMWGGQLYLTRALSDDQSSEAQVRATGYAANLQGSMQRHLVVPTLLSRDPILIQALRRHEYLEADRRLATFREELGVGTIFLLDASGRVVAASDDRPRGVDRSDAAFFTEAMKPPETGKSPATAFTFTDDPTTGQRKFQYSRRLLSEDGETLGVIVVNVDLGLHEESWQRARNRVVVTDDNGEVVLASEPNWRGKKLANLLATAESPSRVGQAISEARRTLTADRFVYIAGTPYLRNDAPLNFRGWNLTYFPTLEGVKARVNSILALVLTGFASLMALAFYLLSRRARAESRKALRESAELRQLNRRLSAEMAARRRVEANLKEAEQSLEQASKLAALGQMSAAVSHELNQPLAAMKTYLAGARLLLNRRRPEEALSSFQRIDDLIDRMGGITRQLKSYARKSEDFDREPVDLRDSVRAALSMMAPQLGKMAVTITSTLPSEPAPVLADPLRLEQIIVNLLRNALDAVRAQDDRRIKIFLVLGETVLLAIEDNGPGIKAPDKLFEPFYTTKKPGEGLGLGLAISAGFAAELGGRLVARNGADGGAVFELLLPRERAQAPVQAAE